LKLELIVLPVFGVDGARGFCEVLRFPLDVEEYRVILLGGEMATAAPGSIQGLRLIVSDMEQVDVSRLNSWGRVT
jgi:hypothetical protein